MLAQCGLCELNWAQFCRLRGNAEKNEVWSCEKPRGGGELDHFFSCFSLPFPICMVKCEEISHLAQTTVSHAKWKL